MVDPHYTKRQRHVKFALWSNCCYPFSALSVIRVLLPVCYGNLTGKSHYVWKIKEECEMVIVSVNRVALALCYLPVLLYRVFITSLVPMKLFYLLLPMYIFVISHIEWFRASFMHCLSPACQLLYFSCVDIYTGILIYVIYRHCLFSLHVSSKTLILAQFSCLAFLLHFILSTFFCRYYMMENSQVQ